MGVAVADPRIALNQHLLAGRRARPAKCAYAVIADKHSVRRRQAVWESSRIAANNSAPCFLPSLRPHCHRATKVARAREYAPDAFGLSSTQSRHNFVTCMRKSCSVARSGAVHRSRASGFTPEACESVCSSLRALCVQVVHVLCGTAGSSITVLRSDIYSP